MRRTSLLSWSGVAIVVTFALGACGVPPAASQPRSPDAGPSGTVAPGSSTTAPGPTSSPSTRPSPIAEPLGPAVPASVLASNSTPEPVRAVAVGWGVCAIRQDGTLTCWAGEAAPPAGEYVALDSAGGSVCAIREDGRLVCWGEGEDRMYVPKGRYTSVSVDQDRACAIRKVDAALVCWSFEEEEEEVESTPPPKGSFTAVSVGDEQDCAIREDGRLVCWSTWEDGRPTVSDARYLAVDLPCAIRVGGGLECDPTDWDIAPASGPPSHGTYVAVSAGGEDGQRGCALRTDGALVCWGDEGYSDDDDMRGLQMRTPAGTFTAVSVGESDACAVRPDGTAVCWGECDECVSPGPTVWLDAPYWFAGRDIKLKWGARALFSPITSYDIDVVTGWDEDGEPTGWVAWRTGTTTRKATFRGTPGETHCWRVRARDADQREGEAIGCTTLPADDSILKRSAGWSTVRDSRYYLGRATATTTKGAKLTIDVEAVGLGIFATTCPNCGSIKVYVGGELDLDGTISLRTNTRHDRQLVFWSNNGDEGFFSDEELSDGHIVIKVSSSGRPVTIDGVLIGPDPDGS